MRSYKKFKDLNKSVKIILLVFLFYSFNLNSQQIYFSFANANNTYDGIDHFYEVDVMINSNTDFKLGSGQLYINYNIAAFGENISSNSNLEYTQPIGSILAEENVLPIYNNFVQADNTSSRVSLSFQQSMSSGSILNNNVTSTPSVLFHLKIKYTDNSEQPLIEFETAAIYLDQTYTACGPSTFGLADCTNNPGAQIFDDNFDNSGATLGISNYKLLTNLTLYPNPVKSELKISGLKDYSMVKIFDFNGKIVFKQNNYIDEYIDISQLSSGTYFLLIQNNNGIGIKNIIKN